jgi:hypothetical protein
MGASVHPGPANIAFDSVLASLSPMLLACHPHLFSFFSRLTNHAQFRPTVDDNVQTVILTTLNDLSPMKKKTKLQIA